MKKYIYALSIVAATLIVGCGEGSSVSDTQFSYDSSSIFGFSKAVSYDDYVVKVYDDEIVEANISAPNCQYYEEKGNGVYLLKDCLGKPLYIQAKNGEIKNKNVKQEFPLLLNTSKTNTDEFVVTPLTTILATASEDDINKLVTKLGVSKEDLFKADNPKIKNLLPKINTILMLSASQGAITNNIKFLEVVRDEIISNINNGDLNTSNVLTEIEDKSTEDPQLFGLVIIENSTTINDNPLETIKNLQQSNTIKFYGLVFDKKIEGANITIKNLDTNTTYHISATSKKNGDWTLDINNTDPNDTDSLYYIIKDENTNYLLQFIATKTEVNKTIKLTSTITTKKLRELINKSKIISPSKENRLIISNITTAQDAILDKKNALNSHSYEGNLSELRVYYQDKILETAAIIKAVVDYNVSMVEANNTYELAKNIITIDSENDTNITITYNQLDVNVTEIESNITSIKKDTILSSQLNMIDTNKQDRFQEVAKNAGYVFYRLLAYYDNGEFIREYTKIITYPSHYETMTCYLKGNSTKDWNCNDENKTIIEDKSNFSLGYYRVVNGNITTTYSLDFNNSVYVGEEINKNYNYYGVIKTEENISSGKVTTEPMILVDSFDVVDAFRRLPTEDNEAFEELQSRIKKYKTKEEVNYELNRWVKSFMNDVEKYFDENETN